MLVVGDFNVPAEPRDIHPTLGSYEEIYSREEQAALKALTDSYTGGGSCWRCAWCATCRGLDTPSVSERHLQALSDGCTGAAGGGVKLCVEPGAAGKAAVCGLALGFGSAYAGSNAHVAPCAS